MPKKATGVGVEFGSEVKIWVSVERLPGGDSYTLCERRGSGGQSNVDVDVVGVASRITGW